MQIFQVKLKQLRLVRALRAALIVDLRMQVQVEQRRTPMQIQHLQVAAALRTASLESLIEDRRVKQFLDLLVLALI